jgi:hypothetical protein
VSESGFEQQSRSWLDEWLLGKVVASVLRDLGLDEAAAWRAVAVIKLLTIHQRWFEAEVPGGKQAHQVLESWLKDGETQQFLQVNRYQGLLWFNREAFEQLLWWMLTLAAVAISADPLRPAVEVAKEIVAGYDLVQQLRRAEENSQYQIEKLLAAVRA